MIIEFEPEKRTGIMCCRKGMIERTGKYGRFCFCEECGKTYSLEPLDSYYFDEYGNWLEGE